MNTIGKNIARLRSQRQMTQEEMALDLGVGRQTLVRWETGKSTPGAIDVIALSEYFGVTSDELLGLKPLPAEGERAVLLRDAETEQPEAHGKRARLPQWMRVVIWLNIGVLWTLLFAFLSIVAIVYALPADPMGAEQIIAWNVSSQSVAILVGFAAFLILEAMVLLIAYQIQKSRKKQQKWYTNVPEMVQRNFKIAIDIRSLF